MRGNHAKPSRSATLIATGAVFAATGPLLAVTAPAQAETTGPLRAIPAPVTPAPVQVKAETTATVRPDTYTVQSGDTMSGIAEKIYGKGVNWLAFWQANAHRVHNPDFILPGQQLLTPAKLPTDITVREAVKAAVTGPSDHAKHLAHLAHEARSARAVPVLEPAHVAAVAAVGTYSCGQLEDLWRSAGGSSATAFMAAEIAKAESGGRPGAVSPTDDFGLWQINGSHGSEATTDPLRNAEAAVAISSDGRDWDPWTTFRTGAYEGLCATETAEVSHPTASHATLTASVSTGLGARLLAAAETRAGDTYVYGDDGPSEFDCSGLIYWAAREIGIDLPRDTYGMLASSRLVRVSDPKPGDLAFFGTGHVELYVRPGETFGAHRTGEPVGLIHYGGSWVPTAFYRVV